MKTLSLLFVLYVLTLTNANALDIEKLKKETLKKAKLQPRDDPKMANLIPLESINDELLEKLQDKCEKNGKCK
ncbi:hypothetical protein [Helicobacter sp. T3_23-1056]